MHHTDIQINELGQTFNTNTRATEIMDPLHKTRPHPTPDMRQTKQQGQVHMNTPSSVANVGLKSKKESTTFTTRKKAKSVP